MQPCVLGLAVLHKSSFCFTIRRWATTSKLLSSERITWTASFPRRQQQVKSVTSSEKLCFSLDPMRVSSCMEALCNHAWAEVTFAIRRQKYGNSLCLLLMFRGLNDVLQDLNTSGDHPLFFKWHCGLILHYSQSRGKRSNLLWISDLTHLIFVSISLSGPRFYCTQACLVFRAVSYLYWCHIKLTWIISLCFMSESICSWIFRFIHSFIHCFPWPYCSLCLQERKWCHDDKYSLVSQQDLRFQHVYLLITMFYV